MRDIALRCCLAWEQHWLSFEGLRLLAEPLLVVVVVLVVLLDDFANFEYKWHADGLKTVYLYLPKLVVLVPLMGLVLLVP